MANTFVTTGFVSPAIMGSLHDAAVVSGLVFRDAEAGFTGGTGNVVNVRKPASFTANAFIRANGVTVQNATETSIPVTLDQFKEVSLDLTAEEQTWSIVDLRAQIVQPAMNALTEDIETKVVTQLTADNQAVSATNKVTATTDIQANLVTAAMLLTSRKVPSQNRFAVLGTTIAATLLSTDKGARADALGDAGQSSREAYIARMAGFDLYVSPYVDANTILCLHPTAIALVTRGPAVPLGAAPGTAGSELYENIALRWSYGFDFNKKQDLASFDVLYGVKTLDVTRSCYIHS